MKVTLLFVAIFLSPASTGRALTNADITSAALVGKTLNFQVTNGTGLLPTSGTWSGTFQNTTSREFIVKNNGGTVSDHQSNYTAINDSKPTLYNLTSVYENSGQATLTLTVGNGQGNYTLSCLFVDPPNFINATQGGTFTIQTDIKKAPEIGVREGTTNLVDGKAESEFGTVKVTRNSKARTYTITNKGTAALKNLKITRSGSNKTDFVITPPGATSIPPGKSTTFKITFQPTGKGPRNAKLRISSNDADENPFDIKLTGTGGG
jgi:hypothetical protein